MVEDKELTFAELSGVETTLRTLAAMPSLARYQFLRQIGMTFEGNRDLWRVLGYAQTITPAQYRDRYERGGIAGAVVDAIVDATWRGKMELIEDEALDDYTPFEQAWIDLDQRLQVSNKFLRVDKLSRLSTFAVLLIGTADGQLEVELPNGKPEQLISLTPFGGGGGPGGSSSSRMGSMSLGTDCTIHEFETDVRNKRFGLPKSYYLRRVDVTSPQMQKPVHWSRIVHVAEGCLDDDVYGQPALERVWNDFDDLEKVKGGGSESFWLRANQGMHVNIDKDMALSNADSTMEKLKQDVENYRHGIDRWIRTRGVEVTPLGADVANFSQPVDALLTLIAGAKRMPKRILTGSEMGELASSQDRDNWKDQITGRQTQHASTNIVRNLADRLIQYGYLVAPAKGAQFYEVRWPHIQTLTEAEKAEGAKHWAETTINGQPVFTDAEIRDKWYGMGPLTKAQRQEMAANAAEQQGGAVGQQLLEDPTFKAAGGVGSGIPGHVTEKDKPAYAAATKTLNQILGGPKASSAVRKKANIDSLREVKTADLQRLIDAYETIEKTSGQKSYAVDRVRQELKLRTASADGEEEI